MNQVATTVKNKPQSNMDFYAIAKNSGTCELECSVCFKGIQKTFFKCGAPCGKIFHASCMEQMIERTNEVAWGEDKEAEHKCCYCRREINIDSYILQRFTRHLNTLKASGCWEVSTALGQIRDQLISGNFNEDLEYQLFEIHRIYHEKKPKQTKRTLAKKQPIKQPRMRVKQNIGGRRR